MQIFKF